jgi:parallel beta-helix repeat protein
MLICSLLLPLSRISVANASPAITIRSDGVVVPETASIQRSGNLYTFTGNISDGITVQKSNIMIDGDEYTLDGAPIGADAVGFTLSDIDNVTIISAKIINFQIGISIESSSHNNITGNYFRNCETNLQLMDVTPSISPRNNIIAKNTIVGNATVVDTGIKILAESSFNTIRENTITGTDYGIVLGGSTSNNSVLRNTLTSNYFGMWLYSTSLNVILENTITDSNWGVYLSPETKGNTIFGNTIANNLLVGVYLLSGSNSNIVRGNTIANNPSGLQMINSSDNKITNNNFINNNLHVRPPSFSDFVNSFDEGYPVGGNFWSNYNGVDSNKGIGQNITGYDGIGDTSHVIDANNTDNYPLVGMFSSFKAYSDLRVETVSNSTINSFSYTNEDGTIKMQVTNALTGFMRATIPKNLIHEPYTVTIDAGTTPVLNLNDTLYDNTTHRWIYFAHQALTHEISIQGTPPDITPPAISILSPEAKAYNKRDIPLTFTINEPTSWIGFSLDGQSNTTTVGNTTLTSLLDGTHTIRVYANDTEGNMGNSTPVNFSIDATPPTIEISSPENITYNSRGVPLTFALSEPSSWIGYSLDSNPNASIIGNTTITNLQNGSHAITIYANDTLGNMGQSSTVHFTIEVTSDDTTPPTISITSPENKTYTTSTNTIDIPLTFNVNEPTLWKAYSLDNEPNVTVNGNTTLTALARGKHKIIVFALDTVGNAAASEEIHFSIEAQPQSEPFPTGWIIAAIIIVIALIALTVYYFRIRKPRPPPTSFILLCRQ